MGIANIVGSPVEGKDFSGRKKELKQAHRKLKTDSLLLSAPRRIGKSSFAKRLIEDKREEGWKCMYIDLQGINTEEEFLGIIIEHFQKNGLWKKIGDTTSKGVKKIFDTIDKISLGDLSIGISLKENKDDFYRKLKELINHDVLTLIVIDELPLFLGVLRRQERGMERVESLLNWLRSIRQEAGTKVRWMFCGSVGLRNFTDSLKLAYSINDLVEIYLDEMDEKEAKDLIKGLSEEIQMVISEREINTILRRLHWKIPYFIQIIISQLIDWHDGIVDEATIEDAFQRLQTGNYMNPWYERLSEYGNHENTALEVLKYLAINKDGADRRKLLNNLMVGKGVSEKGEVEKELNEIIRMLENDGYINLKASDYAFRSPILREWWFNRFLR